MFYCGCGNCIQCRVSSVSSEISCANRFKFKVPERKEGKAFHSICLCAGSQNLPFCDGAHKKLKMMTDPSEVAKIEEVYASKV